MLDFCSGDGEHIACLYRDPGFDKCLDDRRAKGGYAAVAAAKADEFLSGLTDRSSAGRVKFRFTRKGEYRISNCRKIDLGCGYRIVCIVKDRRLVLLYIGTHDECFRWIERRRTIEYDLDEIAPEAWIDVPGQRRMKCDEAGHEPEDDLISRRYEEELMRRVDDALLRKVFAGLVYGRTASV